MANHNFNFHVRLCGMAVIMLLLATDVVTAETEFVRLCGCPQSSACPDNCSMFKLETNECQPIYRCFLEANGIFGYAKPERTADGDILVHIYNDANCQNKRFDTTTLSNTGFKGSCDSDCWSSTISKMGADFCGVLYDDEDESSLLTYENQENVIVQICSCDTSPCPGRCEVFRMNKCQPFYQCLQEQNGVFGFVKPKLDMDGNVAMTVYNDANCKNERFSEMHLIANGFKGSCHSGCWSQISNIGAVACGTVVDEAGGSRASSTAHVGSVVFILAATLEMMMNALS